MEDYYRIKSQNEVNRLLRLPTVDLPVISQADATKYTEWQKNNFYRQALGLPSLPPPRLFYNSPSLTAPTQQQTQHQSLYPSNNPSNNAIPSSQNSCTSLSAYTQCIQRHVATSSGGRLITQICLWICFIYIMCLICNCLQVDLGWMTLVRFWISFRRITPNASKYTRKDGVHRLAVPALRVDNSPWIFFTPVSS